MKNDPKNSGRIVPSILKKDNFEKGGVGEMALFSLAKTLYQVQYRDLLCKPLPIINKFTNYMWSRLHHRSNRLGIRFTP